MRFTISSVVLAATLAVQSFASPLEKRVTVRSGTIAAPTDGSSVSSGESVPFQFEASNWCEAGYSPFSVYILDSKPTAASLNSTQGFTEYLWYYGSYLVANCEFRITFAGTAMILMVRFSRSPTHGNTSPSSVDCAKPW